MIPSAQTLYPGFMAGSQRLRPPLVPTLLSGAAVVLLVLLAAKAAIGIITAIVQTIVMLAALAVLGWIGFYLWRRGGAG